MVVVVTRGVVFSFGLIVDDPVLDLVDNVAHMLHLLINAVSRASDLGVSRTELPHVADGLVAAGNSSCAIFEDSLDSCFAVKTRLRRLDGGAPVPAVFLLNGLPRQGVAGGVASVFGFFTTFTFLDLLWWFHVALGAGISTRAAGD